VVEIIDWIKDRWNDVHGLSSGAWTALAAWIAVVVTVAALVYAYRQVKRAKRHDADLMRPNVAVFMEPNGADWHLIEFVVKNFGKTPAYGIAFEFLNPPTVPRYEEYDDGYLTIVPLGLPEEIPFLAPTQEWRTVWDSALDRAQLGDSIESRFDGAVSYADSPDQPGRKAKRKQREYRTPVVLDWSTLHPAERLELLTTHDMARQEKQKLELLRNVLNYYSNVAKETREDVIRAEIERVRAAADETRDRWRGRVVERDDAPEPHPKPRPQPVQRPHLVQDHDDDPITELLNGRGDRTDLIDNGRHHQNLV
jgi:hypothetical protein